MRNFLISLAVIILGIKFGIDYLVSEDFQKYGDRTKAPWTCQTDIIIGKFYYLMDSEKEAQKFYSQVLTRCPNTPMAEKAEFEMAECFDQMDRWPEALAGYEKFIVNHATSPFATDANKQINRIKSAKSL